jgi:hypothetical protein
MVDVVLGEESNAVIVTELGTLGGRRKNGRLVLVWKGRLIRGLSLGGKIPCGCRWQLGRRVRTSCGDGWYSGAWRQRQDSGCWLWCRE